MVVGVRGDHRELLAADPGGCVHPPLHVLQDLAELLEGAIAGGVAIAVVDRLEAVEVADDHGKRAAAATGTLELGLEELLEAPPVDEPGEAVGAGRAGQPVDQPVRVLALDPDERPGHHQREGDERPVDHRRGLRVTGGEQDRGVGEPGERELQGRPAAAKEVERVDRDPEVEGDVRAGGVPARVDRPPDERGAAGEQRLEAPDRKPAEGHQEQGGQAERAPRGDRRTPLVRRRGQDQRAHAHHPARGEQVHERTGHHRAICTVLGHEVALPAPSQALSD